MKKILLATMLVCASAGALAQNVSLQVGGSGFYGSLELGNMRPPPVLYQQPMVIQQMPQYVNAPPLYLRVPPGHAKKWGKHCSRYNACGRPVLFVQDSWYTNTYVPQYRQSHGGGRDRGYDERPRAVVVERYDDRYDDRRDDHGGKGHKGDKGHGKGHGHGNGKH